MNEIKIDDEWNPNFDIIPNRTIIYGLTAGSGKSYLCKLYSQYKNYKALFVVNNNYLCKEIIEEAKEKNWDINSVTPF